MAECKHDTETAAAVQLHFIEDINRYMADVKIECVTCGKKFRFVGMPMGVNYDLPHCSPDGFEARLPITPEDQTPAPIAGALGFSIRKVG